MQGDIVRSDFHRLLQLLPGFLKFAGFQKGERQIVNSAIAFSESSFNDSRLHSMPDEFPFMK